MRVPYLLRFIGMAILIWCGHALRAQEPIEPGETITGTLSAETPTAEYIFEAQAGDQVTIRLRSRQLDALLRLMDSDASEIASNDDTDGSLDSAIVGLVLPDDGEYTIIVGSADDEPDGEYRLELIHGGKQTIAYGAVIEGEITADVPQVVYELEGQAGDTISIRLDSDAFDPYLTLNEGDVILTQDDDSGDGTNALIGGYTLPDDGTYTIHARPLYEDVTGAYQLVLEQVMLTSLEPDSTVESELEDRPIYYRFEGQAGDQISISVDAPPDLDTELTVKSPDGYVLIMDDDSGDGLNPEVTNATLNLDGTYVLVLQPLGPDAVGPLTLTLTLTEPTELAVDEMQEVTLTGKQPQQSFWFDAAAGDAFRLSIRSLDFDVTNINVNIMQAGELLVNAYGDSVSAEVVAEVEIPADGEVRIMLSDYNYQRSTYEMLLEPVD